MEDILGRLTPERFPQLMKVVATFPITTEERLRGIVDLIYEKAISDPDDSEAYAQMCKCLQLVRLILWLSLHVYVMCYTMSCFQD